MSNKVWRTEQQADDPCVLTRIELWVPSQRPPDDCVISTCSTYDHVHEHKDGFWFYDETDAEEYGPYATRVECRNGLLDYCAAILSPDIKVAFPPPASPLFQKLLKYGSPAEE